MRSNIEDDLNESEASSIQSEAFLSSTEEDLLSDQPGEPKQKQIKKKHKLASEPVSKSSADGAREGDS